MSSLNGVRVLDLPGAYSLDAASPDEAITRDVCRGALPGEAVPDLLVCVADATNLRLHLRFVLEVKRLGRPMVLALNMMDSARRRDIRIDVAELSARLGMPVIETVAVRRDGVADLLAQLDKPLLAPVPDAREAGADLHAEVNALLAATVVMPTLTDSRDDAIDRVLLNPVFGLGLLAVLMFLIFQAVFAWADPFIGMIEDGIAALGELSTSALPEGVLHSTGRWLTASQGSSLRKTEMNFKLEVSDAGALLTRLGTPDALRGGSGQLEGLVRWQGSPLALHYPSMSGQFSVKMGRGQFLKADAGAAKLLGVLSLQALPRRLLLDFRDVFYEGFAFDSVLGDGRLPDSVLAQPAEKIRERLQTSRTKAIRGA